MSICPLAHLHFGRVLNGVFALLTLAQYCVLYEKCTSYLLLLSQKKKKKRKKFSTFQMGRRESPLRFPGGFWWLRFCFSSGLSCLNSINMYWTSGAEEERWFHGPCPQGSPLSRQVAEMPLKTAIKQWDRCVQCSTGTQINEEAGESIAGRHQQRAGFDSKPVHTVFKEQQAGEKGWSGAGMQTYVS